MASQKLQQFIGCIFRPQTLRAPYWAHYPSDLKVLLCPSQTVRLGAYLGRGAVTEEIRGSKTRPGPEQAESARFFPGSPLPPQTMKSACPIINSHHDRDVTKDSGQWEPEISSGQSLASAQNPRVGRRGGEVASCSRAASSWHSAESMAGLSVLLSLDSYEHPAFLCL